MPATATKQPDTAGPVYDLIVRFFGIGDWDEQTATQPHWQYRMAEIGKLKAIMRRRRLTPDDLQAAAEYGHRNHLHPMSLFEVAQLVPAAKRERWQLAKQDREAGFEANWAEALEFEYEAADADASWYARLTRTHPNARKEVYEEWRKQRASRFDLV